MNFRGWPQPQKPGLRPGLFYAPTAPSSASWACRGIKKPTLSCGLLWLVGMTRFELATPCTPCKCATGLRYIPMFFFFPVSATLSAAGIGSGLPLRGCKIKVKLPIAQKFIAVFGGTAVYPIFELCTQVSYTCIKPPSYSLWPSTSLNGLPSLSTWKV